MLEGRRDLAIDPNIPETLTYTPNPKPKALSPPRIDRRWPWNDLERMPQLVSEGLLNFLHGPRVVGFRESGARLSIWGGHG